MIKITPENNLLEAMQDIFPSKGLVFILTPNLELFIKFKNYIKYFARNRNLKILK